MATYEAWNNAIIDYVTAGVAWGDTVFLSIDDDAIEEVAYGFLDKTVNGLPVDDLIDAVRSRIVVPLLSMRVSLTDLGRRVQNKPQGVAFLAATVLASYRMQEEEGIDESNYFLRLREVLRFPPERGRPDGMDAGSEEPLWKDWNGLLVESGFRASAERGAGPQTYLRYVFSQAILRESDKDYLRHRFRETDLTGQLVCDQLGVWLRSQQISRRHLREGLAHPEPSHVWEFYRAAHRLYEAGDWDTSAQPGDPYRTSLGGRVRRIECGLYRNESIAGDVDYLLFPKQPGHRRAAALTTRSSLQAPPLSLNQLRPGFFEPLWAQSPFVENAIEFGIEGDAMIEAMLFPRRDFWILTADPENPFGAWATWKPFTELGDKLLVLVRPGIFDAEMARFRERNLIQWSNRREAAGWVEYEECMVLSYDWGDYIPNQECRPLVDALAPRANACVSLSGGLCDPNLNAWLQGHTPRLRVYGFERYFQVKVEGAQGEVFRRDEVERQQDVELPEDLDPGNYKIDVDCGGVPAASRIFRIVDWNSLQIYRTPPSLVNRAVASTAGVNVSGPFIVPTVVGPADGVAND